MWNIIDKLADTKTEGGTRTYRQTDDQIHRLIHTHTHTHTHKDIDTNKQKGRQIDNETGNHIYKYRYIYTDR